MHVRSSARASRLGKGPAGGGRHRQRRGLQRPEKLRAEKKREGGSGGGGAAAAGAASGGPGRRHAPELGGVVVELAELRGQIRVVLRELRPGVGELAGDEGALGLELHRLRRVGVQRAERT